MVVTCCVRDCSNRLQKGNGISFHQIPMVITTRGRVIAERTERRRREWLQKINRKSISMKTVKPWTRVCSKHFISGKAAEPNDDQNPDWVPTLHMGYDCRSSNGDRFHRAKKRKDDGHKKGTKHAEVGFDQQHMNDMDEASEALAEPLFQECCTQTDFDLMHHIASLELEVKTLRAENVDLKERLNARTFSEETFQNEDEKVKFYTGLPNFLMLMALFNYLTEHISSGPRSVTTKFQEMLMVLMRLRLGLPLQIVADLFMVSESAASRICLKMIDVMFMRMAPLIHWPDRESLRKTMPKEFVKSFGNKVTAIIDCFEVFIETPSSLQARAQTFSSYKHHNTIKYLIGITPQGVVSFISKGWGGRTSDKYVTENSSFLDNLLPGDLVLADRGFDIQESVGLMCAEVKLPAFTRGKKQLSAYDVEATRKIAHVRIHVERVIGNIIQKYAIIDSTIQIPCLSVAENDSYTTLDKMVTICCALVNMCPSVVPFD